MEEIIKEVRDAKRYLLTGLYEEAYVCMQNIDDELTKREIAFYEFIEQKKENE